jgi:hypothetical protein
MVTLGHFIVLLSLALLLDLVVQVVIHRVLEMEEMAQLIQEGQAVELMAQTVK